MKPKARLTVAFWLGSAQCAIWYIGFLALTSDKAAEYGTVTTAIIVLTLAWVGILALYLRNSIQFERETTWMTIKNPAKVNYEQDDIPHVSVATGTSQKRPIRPPPPIAPPRKRKV